MKQSGFFDVEDRLAPLTGLGDQLEVFSWTVDFEAFRPDLDKALAYADGSSQRYQSTVLRSLQIPGVNI